MGRVIRIQRQEDIRVFPIGWQVCQIQHGTELIGSQLERDRFSKTTQNTIRKLDVTHERASPTSNRQYSSPLARQWVSVISYSLPVAHKTASPMEPEYK